MHAFGMYVVFGLAQISDTILTTPPYGEIADAAELRLVWLLFVLVPLATIGAMAFPKVIPTPGLIARVRRAASPRGRGGARSWCAPAAWCWPRG
jgi:hypothetical protein